MPDQISFKMVTKPTRDFLDDRQKKMERAAMYNVRAAGRVVKQVSRAAAPVLADKAAQRHTVYQRAGVWRNSGPPVRGLLKASIASSRRLQKSGGVWSLKVGPRGPRVHLYSKKIENKKPYMAVGYAAAQAQSAAIAQRTYDRVWVE